MKLNLLVLNGLAATALAVPTSKLVTHETRDASHATFTKGAALDGNSRIPVRIALKQRNLENAMDLLLKVSDPRSSEYGNHYTPEQVVSTFAPEAETVESVKAWLISSGIPKDSIHITNNQGWIKFETTASKLESLLDTKYHQYSREGHQGAYVGTDEYKVPSNVADHIDFISPGTQLAPNSKAALNNIPKPIFNPLPNHSRAASDCASVVTPECIRTLYNFTQGSLSDPSNNLGIFEITTEQYVQSDLNKFYAKYAPYVPQGTAPKAAPINGQNPTEDSNEADLDYEIAVPIIYPQGTTNYEVGVVDNDEDFVTAIDGFLEALDSSYCSDSGDCGRYKATNVISISYGDDEVSYSTKALQRQCNEWMKLGLQGTSVLISSGDSGVASRSRRCLGPKHNIFVPGFLVGCPYVTAVGATQIPAGGSATDKETATIQGFSSGGGFSNVNTAPSYQKDALATYFSQHDPGYPSYTTSNGTVPTTGGIYNRAGRGYPDIAANGLHGAVVVDGQFGTSGGTSQSAPLVAGLVNRVINERIKAGKKGPLGFLNPTLYQHPEIFNDITVGDQRFGGPKATGHDNQPSACGNKGFSAVPGWDPVTGLGTPNYPAFLKVFLSQ